jgi:hypothetical protein
MSDKPLPVGWVVKVWTKGGPGGHPVKIFDVTCPYRASAQEAVKRQCGTGDCEIVAVEELVATDLSEQGPRPMTARK